MDETIIEAARSLISFAQENADVIYGGKGELAKKQVQLLKEEAYLLEAYLNAE